MSNDDCKKTNYNAKMITDNMMCAGFEQGQKDACQVSKLNNCNSSKYMQSFCKIKFDKRYFHF